MIEQTIVKDFSEIMNNEMVEGTDVKTSEIVDLPLTFKELHKRDGAWGEFLIVLASTDIGKDIKFVSNCRSILADILLKHEHEMPYTGKIVVCESKDGHKYYRIQGLK